MVLGQLADGIMRGAESLGSAVSETFFDTTVRVGVTGLARAGKTVFITSLVANLMDRGRMPGLRAAAEGRVDAVYLQPQPDDTVPRFSYEAHLADLTGTEPRWPESTRAISQLRLSLRVKPSGVLGTMAGPRVVHLDIVDYPGEWLLDLGLMDQNFADWSAEVLKTAEARSEADAFLSLVREIDGAAPLDEPTAGRLAEHYTLYLQEARAAGYSDCTPGRFLLPGDLAGSPALTFAPLPPGEAPRGSLRREFERRYEAYKRKVVSPFFREHFARLDRQVVLVDLLGALGGGPDRLDDLERAMGKVLGAFAPGRNSWLTSWFTGRRIDRVLFAATQADHLHHSQHDQLARLLDMLLRQSRDRAAFAGAATKTAAVAALRATTEETRTHAGREVEMIRGRLEDTGREVAFHAGALPQTLDAFRAEATQGEAPDFAMHRFAPAPSTLRDGKGPPHIRLDQAAEFLMGDKL